MRLRLSAFSQAVASLIVAWAVFNWAFPPFLPRSLMITYMVITIIGILLYFSSNDHLWAEFRKPIIATLRADDRAPLRVLFLVLIPLLVGYAAYSVVKPSLETPLEIRQVHPAPPVALQVYGRTYDLATLENPLRMKVLELLESDPDAAWETYRDVVQQGSVVYYRNCFFCHGDLLGGAGHFAAGLDPVPTNFRDVGTIAQLQESYLFWRITTGGPGLPRDGMPWKSAMPAWHEVLDEADVWNVITFLYDNVDQLPRMWDQDVSRAVSGMRDEIATERKNMSSEELYKFRCAVCHGEDGAGDGPAADYLYPRPRDFTLGMFKYKSSPGDLPPKDEDLLEAIATGVPGTSMPGWSAVLSDEQIDGLITLIKTFDIAAVWAPLDADWEEFDDDGRYTKADFRVITEDEPGDGQVGYSAESVARGADIYEENCRKCHGIDGRGDITSGKFLEDDWGYRTWARDLTKHWTWRTVGVTGDRGEAGRNTVIQSIYRRLSIGIPGTPMPAHRATEKGEEDAIGLKDRWHVANFVYSLGAAAAAPGTRRMIEALRVAGELPSSIDDPAWEQASASTFMLVPNVITEQRLFTPLNNAITVRVLYNDTEIGFLLDVNDRTESRPGGPVTAYFPTGADRTMYPDAVAIQLPKAGTYSSASIEKPHYQHGDAAHHTTIWFWNAGSIKPPSAPRVVLLDATGAHERPNPRAATTDAVGGELLARGEWQNGRWRVLMKRSRITGAAADINFVEGEFIPVSFANWEGNNGEIGAKHTFTPWYWLLLPPEVSNGWIYGVPLALALITLLAGLWLVRNQRQKQLVRQ